MKLKKIIAIILCAALLSAVLIGCNESDTNESQPTPGGTPASSMTYESTPASSPTEEGEPSSSSSPEDLEHNHESEFKAAFDTFAPKTVMVVAGDYTITWAELFFHMYGDLTYLLGMNPDGSVNWSEQLSENLTLAQAVLEAAVDVALMFKALEYGAKLSGANLSQEMQDMLQANFAQMVLTAGSEEELLKSLWENYGCYSIELYKSLAASSMLVNVTFETLYGENGRGISDEVAEENTIFDGYLMAKHILRLKTEAGGDTPLNETKGILAQLDSYEGEDFGTFFDELMHEHSEDGGLAPFPNGYLFQYGDMVPEFYDACVALEIGKSSGVIETTYGYHIIYRLPINYDEIPSYYINQGQYMTLREIVAQNMFYIELSGWMDSLSREKTTDYEAIDLAALFPSHSH